MSSFPIQATGWVYSSETVGSCIRNYDSFREAELSYSLSTWWCERGEFQKQALIFENNTSNCLIQGRDMWHWYNLLLIGSYLPNLAYTSVTAWFTAKSMSPRPRQKCGKIISTFFNVLLNFSKDCKKQKQCNKQLKPDFFKKTTWAKSFLSCQRNGVFYVLTTGKTEYLSSYAQSTCSLECSTAECWHTLHQTRSLWRTVNEERNWSL